MREMKIIKKYDFSYVDILDLDDPIVFSKILNNVTPGLVYVLDGRTLVGVIGNDEISQSKKNGKRIINRNCTRILDDEDVDKNAKNIFNIHMNWRGVPVVDSQNKMKYEVIYDQIQFYEEVKIPEGEGINHNHRNCKIVISMTTHDERLKTTYLALKSLMFQTMKADEIILYLAKGSGDGELVNERELVQSGVRVERGLEDITCHKKYYYAMREKKSSIIVTADDDNIYDKRFIEDLYNKHVEYPDAVICKYSDRIRYNDGIICPYICWNDDSPSKEPEQQICVKSYAGVLYPVGEYRNSLLQKDEFLKLSEYNDDLWVTACLQENHIKIFNLGDNQASTIGGTQDVALWNERGTAYRNDLYVQNLKRYFKTAYRFKG